MATHILERREQLRPVLKAAVDAEALKRGASHEWAACTTSSLGERPCWSGFADGLAGRFPAEEVDILGWKEMLKRAQDLQLKLRKRLTSAQPACPPCPVNFDVEAFELRNAGRVEVFALSLEGVFQMAYILPERLLALVRPAFDLVLRRIRSLKRCVQACGCKIETPRYACNLAPGCISSEPTFAGLRKTKKKENKGSQKKGSPKKREKGFPFGKA